uniref:Uncharacterized protein n=1 Tax=Romanomermis culicivorax TaxID=13658 RepID=A0A915KBD5_ROMCU
MSQHLVGKILLPPELSKSAEDDVDNADPKTLVTIEGQTKPIIRHQQKLNTIRRAKKISRTSLKWMDDLIKLCLITDKALNMEAFLDIDSDRAKMPGGDLDVDGDKSVASHGQNRWWKGPGGGRRLMAEVTWWQKWQSGGCDSVAICAGHALVVM